MRTIQYEQIICTSSQKSITMGTPGFGVRSKSSGISDMEAEELFTKSGINYRLPMDQMATEETILSNPDVESEFPSLFTFRKVTLNNGEARYIVAKTLYIGLDYGFYAQMDGARRAGSNYIAHLLIFKEIPNVVVLSKAISENLFIPKNTICSPDNKELCSYLVGDPTPLAEGIITIEETCEFNNSDIELGWLLIALLQFYKNNKCEVSPGQNKILFKVDSHKVNKLLTFLGNIPKELTNGMFFQANTRLTPSVPDGFNMLIINEKEDTPTEDNYHITVNLIGGSPKTNNIESNFLYDQIIRCCQDEDSVTLFKIVQLFLGLRFDKEIDYPFEYNLMLLVSTDKELSIDQLSTDTLAKIVSTPVSPRDSVIIWDKINNAINNVFSVPCHASEVRMALEDVNYLRNNYPQKFHIAPNSCNFIIDLLFNKSEMFSGILGCSKERLEGTVYMIEHANKTIPNENALYNALNTSNLHIHWEKFIRLYYGHDLKENIEEIIKNILISNVHDKVELAKALFPIEENAVEWANLYNNNIEVSKTFASLIIEYLSLQISRKPIEGMQKFLSIKKESRDFFDNEKLSNIYLCASEHQPSLLKDELLVEIKDSLEINNATKEKCDILLKILNEEKLTYVDNLTIGLVQKISKNKEYLFSAFQVWLKHNPKAKDIAKFANNQCENPRDVARAIDTLWENLSKKERTDFILKVIDNMTWRKFGRDNIYEHISNKDLKQVLVQENSLIRRFVRKMTSALINMLNSDK